MGKRTVCAAVCLFLGLLVFFETGCRKKRETPAKPIPPLGEIKGDLRVLSALPKGLTQSPSESRAVVVIFDHPMVPVEALPERKSSSFLKLAPSVSGKHRWLGTRSLAFIPDTRLPNATEFEATVPAGTCSLDGYCLKEEFRWRFSTKRPRLMRHFPADGEKNIRLDSSILLVFDQAVPKDKAGRFIAFSALDTGNRTIPLRFRLKNPSEKILKEADIKAMPQDVLLLEPREALKPDFSYAVEIKAALPAEEGPLGSLRSSIFRFETFKTFRFESLRAGMNHNPHEPLVFQFSNPVPYKKLIKAVRFEPEVTVPDYYSAWDQSSSPLWLNLTLEPEKEYNVVVSRDLEDDFGNQLGQDIKIKFKTAPFAPSVSMMTGYGIIEAASNKLYPFSAMNTTRVFVQAARIRKDAVVPLLSLPRVFWTDEKLQPGKRFFDLEKPLFFKAARNKRQAVPIDLKPLLPDGHGFVFLQLDTEAPEKYERYPKAFIQVTELGISAKFSPDNNIIWVSELKTGLPVAGADIEIRDDTNAVRWQGKTDESGKADTPGWKVLGIKGRAEWAKPQQWVFVRRGKDMALTSSEWGTGIYPYRFGIDYDWNPSPETVQGHIFTERGIYRAGETVHIKGIIRRKEKGLWRLPSPSVRTIECEVQDPFQKSIHRASAVLDEYGSFSFDVETGSDDSLGTYQISAKVPPEAEDEKAVLLSESFRIEAFRPAEFDVHLRTPRLAFVFGEDYQGEIRANYLSGGPMSGQKVSWHLRLNPAGFNPPGTKGYIFGNEMDWGDDQATEESRLLASGEGVLDSQGFFKIQSALVPGKTKDSVSATLEAIVESPGRRSISNRIRTIVHRGDYYIGLQPETSFVEKGQKLSLNVIAVDPQGEFLRGKKLSINLFKREWRSVRQGGIGGRFRWRSEKEDTLISSQSVVTKDEALALDVEPEKPGLYFFAGEGNDDRGNRITTSAFFYVTGKDFVPWEQRDDDTIELIADGDVYRQGETAKILVKSPYERAKALVTIEREFILESRVLEIHGNSNRIEIPIKPEYIPNVFVSVLLIQGRTDKAKRSEGQDIGKPSFKLGCIKLAVNSFEKKLGVDIVRDKKDYKPRDRVTLKLKVKDAENAGRRACLSLAVVDVGVLNLIGFQTPDPFGRFYGERPLSVQTSETRLHIVGQREYGEKGEDMGGGGEKMMEAAAVLSEAELRGDFKSTAYWNPSLVTDDAGEASVTFDLPDNLTSFRVMAVAQTKDSAFGAGEDAFRVSKVLQLRPSLPRFARVGDAFDAGVVVRNLSESRDNVSLNLEVQGIHCADDSARTFSLGPGEAREIRFAFRAEAPGRSRLAFRAKMGNETDGIEMDLPIRLPRPMETVAFTGLAKDAAEERIRIPENVFHEESLLEIQTSPTAMSGLKGSLDYLKEYPYLCLEQRLSAILPYLVACPLIFEYQLSPMDQAEAQVFVRSSLRDIYGYQREDGAFGLWPDSPRSSPFLTGFALFALIKAQEGGYDVDRSRVDQAAQFLRDWLRSTYDPGRDAGGRKSWNTTRAFALYDLALLNTPEPAYAEKLFAERADLSLFGRTLLLKALHVGKGPMETRRLLLEELLNMVKVSPTEAHFEDSEEPGLDWIYSSNIRTTALILQTLILTDSGHPLIPLIAKWIVEKRKSGHWHSTQENFYVFYALNAFYRNSEKGNPDFRYAVTLDVRTILESSYGDLKDEAQRARLTLSELASGKDYSLKIQKDGSGSLFYTGRMAYAPRDKLQARDEGIVLVKRMESLDGKPLQSVKAGSLAVVTLDVVMPQEGLFIVVDDPLPAGFEAVNPVFDTESEEQALALENSDGGKEGGREDFGHIEMRDDRVLLFADSLEAGLHTHRYLVRALTFGTFQTPGAKAEEMYSPEVFGRSPEQVLKIEK